VNTNGPPDQLGLSANAIELRQNLSNLQFSCLEPQMDDNIPAEGLIVRTRMGRLLPYLYM